MTNGPPESPEQAPLPPVSIGPVQTFVVANGSELPERSTKAFAQSKGTFFF